MDNFSTPAFLSFLFFFLIMNLHIACYCSIFLYWNYCSITIANMYWRKKTIWDQNFTPLRLLPDHHHVHVSSQISKVSSLCPWNGERARFWEERRWGKQPFFSSLIQIVSFFVMLSLLICVWMLLVFLYHVILGLWTSYSRNSVVVPSRKDKRIG